MADKFQIVGSWGTTPQTGSLLGSGAPSILAPINESVVVAQKNFDDYLLDVDTPVPVQFGGVANAHVVILFADRKVRARLTSADGAVQSIPFNRTLMIISEDVPFTAIDLTRVPAQETRVKVFVGQKS